MLVVRSAQPFSTCQEASDSGADPVSLMASTGLATAQQDAVQFRIWPQDGWMEYTGDEEAKQGGFYTLAGIRAAYPHVCTQIAGPGYCKKKTRLQCQLQEGEE